MGWLSRELDAGREELQGEDIDSRTYGELLHNVHHDIIAKILDFPTSEERSFEGHPGLLSVEIWLASQRDYADRSGVPGHKSTLVGEIGRSFYTAP